MTQALRIDSVRGRLTLFWVAVLAAALIAVGGLIYVLLARALYSRIDDNLRAVVQIATTSLDERSRRGTGLCRCGAEHRGGALVPAADAGHLRHQRPAARGRRA